MQFPDDGGSAAAAGSAPVEFDDANSGSSGSSSRCSESARRLIRGLLTVDPQKRVRSLRTLKNHAFYHHFDFESLASKKVERHLFNVSRNTPLIRIKRITHTRPLPRKQKCLSLFWLVLTWIFQLFWNQFSSVLESRLSVGLILKVSCCISCSRAF